MRARVVRRVSQDVALRWWIAALVVLLTVARARGQVAVMAERAQVTEAQFQQWVFQNSRTAAAARERLKAQLQLHIADVDRVCSLEDGQRTKLALAGAGDVKRFFDEYQSALREFRRLKEKEPQAVQNKIFAQIRPLQTKYRSGLFHDQSIFYKCVRGTLTDRQMTKYQAVSEERAQLRLRARVELLVCVLEQSVPLLAEQRNKLVKLLLEEIPPSPISGQYDYYLYLYYLSNIPEERLAPVKLDEVQRMVFARMTDQGRGLEGFLRENGYLPLRAED